MEGDLLKPIHCLAISNSYPPDHAGGYELGACNILEHLAEGCAWKNTVLSAVRNEKSPKTDPLTLTGFFPGRLGPEIEGWRTKRVLLKNHDQIGRGIKSKAAEADVVFVFNPRRLIYPEWTSVFATETPVFVFVSDHWPNDPLASDIFHFKSKKDGQGELRDQQLQEIYSTAPKESGLLPNFRGVIFGSRFLQKEQANVFASNPNQSVVHWGINSDQFPQVPHTTDKREIFGFCGRPEKEKGLDLALEAIRELAMDDAEVRLLVASDLKGSSYGRAIFKHIQNDSVLKDCVSLLGQVPHADLHKTFYSQIGTLLFPSIWQEPFALTVLEAMASGVLVIASSTGGTPEVVEPATGYLFDPEVSGDLTRVCRISQVADAGDIQRIIEQGARRIREFHTLPIMASRVDEFIRAHL
ncbi:glycosyltransferase family 4 protein [Opitutia bacterium ISCC 51]|nr:glycosyltransferase family 4 protein [Opitutae bacterium ISCC 51]QXD27470.1 glycosyltransferase family 4 protein [Opitutae bacterium ISCC 52]